MQLQTLFVIISLQTTMRGFDHSFLSIYFDLSLLCDVRHQLRQSYSCMYLALHLHSL